MRLASFRAAAKASGLLDPASPSGISEEDENFSFPLTPPSEPAAPAAVFSSWHSFRKRSSKARPSLPCASLYWAPQVSTLCVGSAACCDGLDSSCLGHNRQAATYCKSEDHDLNVKGSPYRGMTPTMTSVWGESVTFLWSPPKKATQVRSPHQLVLHCRTCPDAVMAQIWAVSSTL